MRRDVRLWAGLFALAVCAVVVALRFQLSTDITRFAIDPGHAQDARWIEVLAASEPARTMVVTVEHDDREVALVAAAALRDELARHEEVEWARIGPDPALGQDVHTLFFPRRFRFVSPDPETGVPARFSDDALARAAEHLKSELARPSGVAVKRLAKDDPWLLFLDRTAAMRGPDDEGFRVDDGRFVTASGHALLLVATRHGPMQGVHQIPLHDAIEAAIAEVTAEHGVVVERSALHRFAVTSERAVRADVQTLSTLSSLAVLTILLVAFRSLRQLVLVAVPMAAGVLAATAVTLVVFGGIHGLTLAFGTTLIGVCVDYPVHLLTHHAVAPRGTPASVTMRQVWPGLVLGALTTVAGFLALAGSPLPGLREIGVFAAVGVGVALVATRGFVVRALPVAGDPHGLPVALARMLERGLVGAGQRRAVLAFVLLAVAGIAAVGATRVQWVDDARALQRMQPGLMEEDARVRARVGSVDVGRVLIATGPSLEAALQVQDQVFARLRAHGLDRATRSSQPVLWSAALQDENLARVRAQPELARRTAAALALAGFRPEAFGELAKGWEGDPGPLDLSAIEATALAPLVRPFVVEMPDPSGPEGREDSVALLSFLRASADAAALESAIAGLPNASVFDQRGYFADTYRGHREGTLVALAMGLVAVAVLLAVRYRSARIALAALTPAVLGVFVALGVLALVGTELQLLHLVACMLVLSMGVDYGVFAAESGADPRARAAALVGVAIACATTVASFAVLAIADNPALRALGATTALGVGTSALLTPVTMLLLGNQARTRREDDGAAEVRT